MEENENAAGPLTHSQYGGRRRRTGSSYSSPYRGPGSRHYADQLRDKEDPRMTRAETGIDDERDPLVDGIKEASSPIDQDLNNLQYALRRLNRETHVLFSQLVPVMLPYDDVEESDDSATLPPRSALSDRIYEQTTEVNRIREIVEEMRRRLEV